MDKPFIPRKHVLGCICLQCQPETRTEDMYAYLFKDPPKPVVCCENRPKACNTCEKESGGQHG